MLMFFRYWSIINKEGLFIVDIMIRNGRCPIDKDDDADRVYKGVAEPEDKDNTTEVKDKMTAAEPVDEDEIQVAELKIKIK